MTLAGAWAIHGFANFSVIDWAFANLGWTEIIHVIDVGNTPSQAVARKLGSANRGRAQLPPPHADAVVEIWGQTKADWTGRRRSALRASRETV